MKTEDAMKFYEEQEAAREKVEPLRTHGLTMSQYRVINNTPRETAEQQEARLSR